MRIQSTDGVSIELHDLGGDGAPVLIVHATGFCAGAYRPFATPLARQRHVWGVDVRGHGEASIPDRGSLDWRAIATDVLTAMDSLSKGPIDAIGHSMGGACLVLAELARPGSLRRAWLFEPIIMDRSWIDLSAENPLATAARRRRSSFATREAALARYAARPPLGTFRADALSAYVEAGFVDEDDGSVSLRCAPEVEGDVFDAPGKPMVHEIGSVTTPIQVARGARDRGPGPADLAPLVADALQRGEIATFDHVGHFGPFQDPDGLAAAASSWLNA